MKDPRTDRLPNPLLDGAVSDVMDFVSRLEEVFVSNPKVEPVVHTAWADFTARAARVSRPRGGWVDQT